MIRNKKPGELFKKVHGKKVILFDINGDLAGKGEINFETKKGDGRLYLNNKEIPLSSVRSIVYDLMDYEGLIFVESRNKYQANS